MTARRRIDLRLAVPAAAAWVTAAVLQTGTPAAGWVLAAAATAAGLLAAAGRRLLLAGAMVGVGLGAATMAVHLGALRTGPVAALARGSASATLALRLVRDPVEVTSARGRRLVVADATATAVEVPGGGWRADRAPVVVFVLAGRWLGLLPGQRLVVSGRLAPPRGDDPVSAVLLAAGPPRLLGRPPPWQRWAGRVRDDLRRACAGLPGDERGLVPGLVLGDVSAMPPTLTQAFRVTGLAHLMAVSGANVAILLGAVGAGMRTIGASRSWRAVVGGVALAAFVVLARPAPSVLRAAVMGAVVLVATLLGRRTSAVPVLAAAVLLLVVVDPFLAPTPGFAMSVLATAAIVVVGPVWTDRLCATLPRPLAAAVAVPAAAQLACTPVIVAAFGQLTPLAVPANLLAAPAVAPATLAGIGAAVTAGVARPVAVGLAQAAGLAAGWLALVARTLAAVPGAALGWPTGVRGVLLLTGCGAVLLGGGWLLRRRRRRRPEASVMPC